MRSGEIGGAAATGAAASVSARGGVTLTIAAARSPGSPARVASTVAVRATEGATNRPPGVIVPRAASPPTRPSTVHSTGPSLAVNCTAPPGDTRAEDGASVSAPSTRNGSGDCAAPAVARTATGPVVAPAGTTTVSRVGEAVWTTAGVPLNVTWLLGAPAAKPLPKIDTRAPQRPAFGLTSAMATGSGSDVASMRRIASTLPTASYS